MFLKVIAALRARPCLRSSSLQVVMIWQNCILILSLTPYTILKILKKTFPKNASCFGSSLVYTTKQPIDLR